MEGRPGKGPPNPRTVHLANATPLLHLAAKRIFHGDRREPESVESVERIISKVINFAGEAQRAAALIISARAHAARALGGSLIVADT